MQQTLPSENALIGMMKQWKITPSEETPIYQSPIMSSFEKNFQRAGLYNYTTLVQKMRYSIGLYTHLSANVATKMKVKMAAQLTIDLDNQNQNYLQFNCGTKQQKIGFIRQFDQQHMASCHFYLSNKTLEFEKYVLRFYSNNWVLKAKDQKLLLSYQVYKFQKLQPWLFVNSNNISLSKLGLRLNKGQMDIAAYVNSQGLSIETGIKHDEWRFAVQFVMQADKYGVCVSLQRSSSVAILLPITNGLWNNLQDKLTTICLVGAMTFTIFKCFMKDEPPKLTRQQRVQKSRQLLHLMNTRCTEVHKYESSRNGLIITQAYYGLHSDILKISEQQNRALFLLRNDLQIIDVSLALMFYIKQSTLQLPESSKQHLQGFCDPCESPNDRKSLLVYYTLHSVEYMRIYSDEDQVSI